ncbi:hypothetical protein CVT24_005860 [Panaeolus cyanescens]|uniref:Uncharacterized protein n=1 Tax=Panaeolus cyanescens TaxID=181874 RepID=A0A409YF07_9AGAR|nr:hypothetical protein CVT24_005860 [Panaeolus cyanescens]
MTAARPKILNAPIASTYTPNSWNMEVTFDINNPVRMPIPLPYVDESHGQPPTINIPYSQTSDTRSREHNRQTPFSSGGVNHNKLPVTTMIQERHRSRVMQEQPEDGTSGAQTQDLKDDNAPYRSQDRHSPMQVANGLVVTRHLKQATNQKDPQIFDNGGSRSQTPVCLDFPVDEVGRKDRQSSAWEELDLKRSATPQLPTVASSQGPYAMKHERNFRGNNRNMVYGWYRSSGPTRIEYPPTIPGDMQIADGVLFVHVVMKMDGKVDCIQSWIRVEGSRWEFIEENGQHRFGSDIYVLSWRQKTPQWSLPGSIAKNTWRKHNKK